MSNNIVCLVEGERREPEIIRNLQNTFFRNSNIRIFTLPAKMNIHMLYEKLKKDEFETDFFELLKEALPENQEIQAIRRDSISELYLVFDFDLHHQNDPEQRKSLMDHLSEMFRIFDNETQNGKLYISYPMAQALADQSENGCDGLDHCLISVDHFKTYKKRTSLGNNHFSTYGFNDWKKTISVFLMRISCICLRKKMISVEEYKNSVSPDVIFRKESAICSSTNKVVILSAFPEFLLDYFKQKFLVAKILDQNNRDLITDFCDHDDLYSVLKEIHYDAWNINVPVNDVDSGNYKRSPFQTNGFTRR